MNIYEAIVKLIADPNNDKLVLTITDYDQEEIVKSTGLFEYIGDVFESQTKLYKLKNKQNVPSGIREFEKLVNTPRTPKINPPYVSPTDYGWWQRFSEPMMVEQPSYSPNIKSDMFGTNEK